MKKLYILMLSLLLACSKEGDFAPAPGEGSVSIGGSMARMAMSGDHLFVLTDHELQSIDISNPAAPVRKSVTQTGFGMETIFPKEDLLFLGSEWGMHIYDISNPDKPEKLSIYEHIVSCDPVVADDKYAYVTLRTGNNCWRGVNRLEIIDISDVRNPFLVSTYEMENPKGLGIDNSTLFVCDDGLKILDVANPHNVRRLAHYTNMMNGFDVIPYKGLLMVIAEDGFYQYSYENNRTDLLSKISITPANP